MPNIYNDAQFSILATARSSLHLSVLKAAYSILIPDDLFAFKKNLFIHSKFCINFFGGRGAHFELKQNNNYFTNQILKMTYFGQSK